MLSSKYQISREFCYFLLADGLLLNCPRINHGGSLCSKRQANASFHSQERNQLSPHVWLLLTTTRWRCHITQKHNDLGSPILPALAVFQRLSLGLPCGPILSVPIPRLRCPQDWLWHLLFHSSLASRGLRSPHSTKDLTIGLLALLVRKLPFSYPRGPAPSF